MRNYVKNPSILSFVWGCADFLDSRGMLVGYSASKSADCSKSCDVAGAAAYSDCDTVDSGDAESCNLDRVSKELRIIA